jgi:signal transduction histidine kinase
MATFLGVPVVVRGQAWGNLYLTEKATGDEFDEQDEEAILILAAWAAKAIDNARLYQAEHSRRDALERTVGALEATTEIARATGGETRLERVLELIVKRGRALVEAESMLLLLQDGDELTVMAVAGGVRRDMVGQRVPIEGSETGAVLRRRSAERITDVKSRLRYGIADRLEATTGLLVPLLFHGRPLGVLAAFDRLTGGPRFSAEDERLMEAFAASAATAVATAQNVAQLGLRRSIEAAETERGRWARELHDDTLQAHPATQSARAPPRRITAPPAITAVLADAVAQIDSTIRDLRAIINDLRPATLDALGVVPAVEALVERAMSRSSVDVSVTADLAFEAGRSAQRLAPGIELAVYRLVQEAITNAVRHSGASTVRIELTEKDDLLTVRVRDNGSGFDPTETHAGFGLIGMRERVTFAGGNLTVESSAGGTQIAVALPATRRPEAAPANLAEEAGSTGQDGVDDV